MHSVLDIPFHEDASRIRRDNAPENMALLRHFALNLLKRDKSCESSISARRKKAAWEQAYIIKPVSL